MSTEHEMEKLERSKKIHISTKLEALFKDLEENAYDGQYHKYWIKQANQIIRTHFDALEASNKVFAIGFAQWLKTNAYSKDSSWYLHEAMDGNIYSESELIAKYEKHLEETKQNTLVFIKESEGKYTIRFNKEKGSVFMGELIRDFDGYFYWFPVAFKGSCYNQHTIKLIQEKLIELNKEWDEKVQNELLFKPVNTNVLDFLASEKQNATKEPLTSKGEVNTEKGEFFLIKNDDGFHLRYKQGDLVQDKPLSTEKDHIVYKGVLMTLGDFFNAYHNCISNNEIEQIAFNESKNHKGLLNVQERYVFQAGFEDGFKACLEMFKDEKFTEEDMINMAKYGYEFRDTTQFPKQTFEENCINNTKQLMQSLYEKKNFWKCTYKNETITIID